MIWKTEFKEGNVARGLYIRGDATPAFFRQTGLPSDGYATKILSVTSQAYWDTPTTTNLFVSQTLHGRGLPSSPLGRPYGDAIYWNRYAFLCQLRGVVVVLVTLVIA